MAGIRAPVALDEARAAKRAARAAMDYFKTIFGLVANLSLEEIELSSDRKYWLVTLSFEEPRQQGPGIPGFLRLPRQKFKILKVERESGRVVSVKMRNGE